MSFANVVYKKGQKYDKMMQNYDYVMSGKIFKSDESENQER